MRDLLYELRSAVGSFESIRWPFVQFREQLDAALASHHLTQIDLSSISDEGPWFEVNAAGRRFRIQLTEDPDQAGFGLFNSWLLQPFEPPAHVATIRVDNSGAVAGELNGHVTTPFGAAYVLARLLLPAIRPAAVRN